MTITETYLVDRVRDSIGDNPTKIVLVGEPPVETDVQDISKQIWSDAEYLRKINSARITMFKGKRTSLEELSELEQELIILRTTADCHYILATDSAKYVRYKLKDTEVEKIKPEGFLAIAKALEDRLETLIEEGAEVKDIGSTISQSVIRRFDKQSGYMLPSRYQPTVPSPPFFLTKTDSGIEIKLQYIFIDDFNRYFIQKQIGNYKTLIANEYVLREKTYVDSDVQAGNTYTYIMNIETINGEIFSSEKSITI